MKLPSTEFVKRPIQPATNYFENQAMIPMHEDLSFVMKVVRESTAIGNLVAYLRGEPAKILEVCTTYEYEGEARRFHKNSVKKILNSI